MSNPKSQLKAPSVIPRHANDLHTAEYASARSRTRVPLHRNVTILGSIAAIVVCSVYWTVRLVTPSVCIETRLSLARYQVSSVGPLSAAIELFEHDLGCLPEKLEDLIDVPPATAKESHWRGPYLTKDDLNDPWGHRYGYKRFRVSGTDQLEFRLWSFGRDGIDGTPDDVR